MADRLELPGYAEPDVWLDDNNALELVRWKDETEPYQALWWHRSARPDAPHVWCLGSVRWRIPPAPEHFPADSVVWDLVSWEPLTISPSLLCSCGAHGFIRDSKWVSV